MGWVEDGSTIVCPGPGWKFDVTDGRCVDDDRYRGAICGVEVEGVIVSANR